MKTIGKRFLKIRFFVLLVLLFLPIGVQADPILDFGITAPASGGISYGGGGGPLQGGNISVAIVTGLETSLNPGVPRNLIGGTLNFTTGNFAGFDGSDWYFGVGGGITLTGGVDLDNNGNLDPGDIPLGTTLLSGFLNDNTIVYQSTGAYKVVIGAFVDTVNPNLINFYGLPPNIPYLGNFQMSFEAPGSPPGKFTSTGGFSGDLTASPSPVPEPATMLLLGCGLVGLASYGRRKFRKPAV